MVVRTNGPNAGVRRLLTVNADAVLNRPEILPKAAGVTESLRMTRYWTSYGPKSLLLPAADNLARSAC